MITNITLGQYYPVDSPVHRLDPRNKIILTIAMIVCVFLAGDLIGYALVLAGTLTAARLANVPVKIMLRGLKPLRFILLLTFLLNPFSETVFPPQMRYPDISRALPA